MSDKARRKALLTVKRIGRDVGGGVLADPFASAAPPTGYDKNGMVRGRGYFQEPTDSDEDTYNTLQWLGSGDKQLARGGRLGRDTGGNALRGAIDSFARQRQQSFDNPANNAQLQALALAQSNSSPPQLAVAEPPQQQRSTSRDMAQQTTDFGSALDDGIGMLTGRDSSKPVAAKPTPGTVPATPSPQGQGAAPVVSDQDSDTALGALKKGISGEESGGRYGILGPMQKNGDYAVGKYQIMASNIPSWTKQALGRAMTPDEFRASPQAQEDVTSHILGGYLTQYGPKGAAAMWFSGKPNVNSSARDSLGTSVPNYVANATRGMQSAQQPTGPVSEGDIPQDTPDPQAARGGFMRKHYDAGGDAGGDASYGGGANGDGDSTGTSVSANSTNTGYGNTADGDNGAGFATGATAGTASTGMAGHGSPGAASGVGGATGGGNGGPSAGSAGAGTSAAGAATGGGGGTASGGSGIGHGGTGYGGSVGGNGGPMAGSVQANNMAALQAAMNHQAISTSGDPGVASLGVPPGLLSGVSTAVSPVTVSQLGPPSYSQATINAVNALFGGNTAAAQAALKGQGASTGYGNVGFGGGSPGQGVGQGTVGFNSSPTGAEGVSTAGLGTPSGGATAATSAPSSVLGYTGPSSPSSPTSPGVTAMLSAMRGAPAPAQQNQAQQVAAPAPTAAQANNNSGGRYGNNAQPGGEGRHQRGGMVTRASGGGVASMPTQELIAKAMQILARRKAASGGKQISGLGALPAAAPSSAPKAAATVPADAVQMGGNYWDPSSNSLVIGSQFLNDFNTIDGNNNGNNSAAAAAPAQAAAPVENTPAVGGQYVGNSSGAGGAPLGQIPMASPGGSGYGGAAAGTPTYSNTLNEALGTNNPTMDQVFGFKYPVPPAPKAQPVGPISQNQVNALYGLQNGSQLGLGEADAMGAGNGAYAAPNFNAGGAIIMDALTRANKARKAKGKR